MQEFCSSKPPEFTGTSDSKKSWARHHRSLKLGSKLKYLNKNLTKKFWKKDIKAIFDQFWLVCPNIGHERIFNQNQLTIILSTHDPLHLWINPEKSKRTDLEDQIVILGPVLRVLGKFIGEGPAERKTRWFFHLNYASF